MFNMITLDKKFTNACRQLKLDPKVVLDKFMADFCRPTSDVNVDIHNWRITSFPDKEGDFFQIGVHDLKTILYKFNIDLTNALEAAVGDVMKRTSFYVTIEDFLLKIAEHNDSFKISLATIGFDPDDLTAVWNDIVNKQRTGNKDKPAFSPSFVSFVNNAYHKCLRQDENGQISQDVIISVLDESEKLKLSWNNNISN